jgi:hypothetical protein
MKKYAKAILLATLLLGCGLAMAAARQSGPTFQLVRDASDLNKFDLIITDGDEMAISGSFSKRQIEVFRNLLIEAKKFALSEEEVGAQEPKTTRFASQSEPALVVDISKLDDQSQIYLTLTTEAGHMTIEAGLVRRRAKREEGLFFNLLSRMQALVPATAAAK